MNEQPITEVKKFNPGDKLAHPRGATAIVLEAVMNRRHSYDLHGYKIRITQENGNVQTATVPLSAFGEKGWKLEKTAEQVAAEEAVKPAPAVLPTEPAIDPYDEEEIDDDVRKVLREIKGMTALGMAQWIASLEEQLEAARESRDEAITTAGEAMTHATAMEGQVERLEKFAREQAENHLGKIKQLEAKPINLSAELKVEIKTLVQLIGLPEKANHADQELATQLNDGWEKWDCSIIADTGDPTIRVVTLQRYCQQPAPAPQPERAAAKVVTPAAISEVPTTIPVDVQADIEAAVLTMRRADEAAQVSPLPGTFNARADFQQLITDAVEAGQREYNEFMQMNPLPVRTLIPGQGVSL